VRLAKVGVVEVERVFPGNMYRLVKWATGGDRE
jgi:hypothetical protein